MSCILWNIKQDGGVATVTNKMVALAECLSKDVPFLRVDFYNVNGKIYFGELTFYPASGMGQFIPKEMDKEIGYYLDLIRS